MRAQTTLDFMIGTAAFLLAVGLVVGMVPGMLDPFSVTSSSAPVTANRAIGSLAGDELAATDRPFVLSEPAVADFFNLTETGVRTRLGMSDDVTVNVTLQNSSDVVVQTVGPPVPQEQSTTTAWRVVSYKDEQSVLTVRIW